MADRVDGDERDTGEAMATGLTATKSLTHSSDGH